MGTVFCLRAGPDQAGKEACFAMNESRDRERERNSKGKANVKWIVMYGVYGWLVERKKEKKKKEKCNE